MTEISIHLRRAIIHILDNSLGMPVLSDKELSIKGDVSEFLQKHIIKILKDENLKEVKFERPEDNDIKKLLDNIKENNDDFINVTKFISTKLYEIMLQYQEIPSADIVFLLMEIDGMRYLVFMKLNYKDSFIHHIMQEETERYNSIIKQQNTLPNINQTIEECGLINLSNYSIKIKEKKYDLDGNKDYYLTKLLFKTTDEMSYKEKLEVIDRTAKKIVKNYYNDDHSKMIELRKAMQDSVENKNKIDIEEVSKKVFENEEIKKEYINQIEEKGLKEKEVEVNEKLQKKIFKKQRIITDTGIELKIPIDYLRGKDVVEFIDNVDGTYSILIKNVEKLVNK